jgi:hypothetical protein
VRSVQLCHRFVACMQRRNLPAGTRRWLAGRFTFTLIFLFSTTLLVFPPTGGPQPFFYWRDIAKMRN